ncbi:TauD/TfdA dioxygenase family protein [Pseudomonas fluorescens]|jgi:taurine dioxygenase|nr:TauD/TfdA family dioxygenase [Pseudomonas fluorescens]
MEPFGIEVDLDLRDENNDARVAELFKEYGFLLFREQDLTQEQQKRVMSKLGPVLEDFTTVGYVSNTRKDGVLGDSEVSFHLDFLYTPVPLLGISLHGIEVPYEETWTRFASGRLALEALPPATRERLRSLKGLNLFSASEEGLTGRQRLEGYPDNAPRAEHPLIHRDPITGQEVLFATQQNTALIVGLSEDDSEELIAEMHAHLYADSNIYEHRWRNGDIVIWSNQALHHARGGLVPGKTRTLQRVCITEGQSSDYRPPIPADRLPPQMRM